MARPKAKAPEAVQDTAKPTRKHALQIRITPEDEARLERLQARYGFATAADVVRSAITLMDETPAPKLRPKKSDRPS